MEVLDALAAEYRRVLAAVEVLDPLVVVLAEVGLKLPRVRFILFVQIDVRLQALFEVHRRQQRVVGDDFVQNVEVEGQLVNRLDAFEQFAAKRAPDSLFPEEVSQAGGAEGVAAAHDYPGDPFAHVELQTAEVAQIQPTRLVGRLNFGELELCWQLAILGRFENFEIFGRHCHLILLKFEKLERRNNYKQNSHFSL